MPVNMPTHGHGQGYSDLGFLLPELVSGVQFSKGPYFADQGDFATAGASNINYVNTLARPESLLNADLGFKPTRALRVGLEVFNILNALDSDIDYFYTSRLGDEPADGIADIHFHPALPRQARLNVTVVF